MPRPSRWTEIVAAAGRLFQAKGFAATSLEDIASEVGMWKGSLYHYIESKEDLLFAVVREPADDLLRQVRDVVGLDLPPAEKIRLIARSHGSVLEHNFVFASVYLQEIAGRQRDVEWSAMDREYLRAVTGIVEEGIASGDFAGTLNARTATLSLIGSLNWMTHWYRPDGPIPASVIADEICSTFLNGSLSRQRASMALRGS